MTERERIRRNFQLSGVEIRAADDGKITFRGYAAVFNSASVDFGGWREVIEPGAFTATLAAGPRVLLLHNHDANLVLASTDNGTLKLSQDEKGLLVEATFADVSYSSDVATLYREGYLAHMSFAFWIVSRRWDDRGGEMFRVIEEVDMDGGDVSTVAYPAYLGTSGEIRGEILDALRRVADLDPAAAKAAFAELRDGHPLDDATQALLRRAAAALDALVGDDGPPSGDIPSIIDTARDRTLRLHERRMGR